MEVFEQRGYKLNGRARVVEPGDPDYESRVAPLEQIATEHFGVRAFIELEVLSAVPIVAPRYKLYKDTTPEAQAARAVKAYNRRLEPYGLELGLEPP